ncbi:MAG TPA: hypothetical protein VIE65_23770 [Methylobacter sp.]|jgi:hypothetical protein
MQTFEKLSETEISQLLRSKTELKFIIGEAVTNFKGLSGTDFSDPTEVPPTSAIFTPEGLAHVICTGTDLAGKFIRIVVTIYAYGGKIFYKRLADDSYEAHVRWPESPA